MMRNPLTFVTILIVVSALTACAGPRVAVEDGVIAEPVTVVTGEAGEAGASGLDGDDSLEGTGLDEGVVEVDQTNSLLNQRVVYFDYDSSSLTRESEDIVQAHAQYLSSTPGTAVILEGHADERGIREYNLSLGEDRAQSVATLMKALGVGAGTIQAISYGEERPVSLGSDEDAWSLNRRVEILYQ